MSLIFPKKEILYAPMLGTLGGGSARGMGFHAGKSGLYIDFAMIGGGGGGGDGNAAGGAGGAGGLIEGRGIFPTDGTRFRIYMGVGGDAPPNQDVSGNDGDPSELVDDSTGGNNFRAFAGEGGRGASYSHSAGPTTGQYGGCGGGGSGPSNNNARGSAGSGGGILADTGLVGDITSRTFANDGGAYSGTYYTGGGGGGVGGAGLTPTTNESSHTRGNGRNPQAMDNTNIWVNSGLTWGRGGGGGVGGTGTTGANGPQGFGHLGNGGGGSSDNPNQQEQSGNHGGLILRMPLSVNINIHYNSNGNCSQAFQTDSNYRYVVFYDATYYGNGENTKYSTFSFYKV